MDRLPIPSLLTISDFSVRSVLLPIVERLESLENNSSQIEPVVAQGAIEKSLLVAQNRAVQQSGTPYTAKKLQQDLLSGVKGILAQAGEDYLLKVDNDNATIAFAHREVLQGNFTDIGNVTGIPAGAAYRPGMVLASGGIGMGYADAEGGWHNAVAIGADGNASFEGSVNATSGNFAESITVGSFTLSDIGLGKLAHDWGNHADQGYLTSIPYIPTYTTTDLQNDLQAGYAQVIGDAAFSNSGNLLIGSESDGVKISQSGIAAKRGGAVQFSIDSSGNASFAGNINGAGGNFTGTVLANKISAGVLTGHNIRGASIWATQDQDNVGAMVAGNGVKTPLLGNAEGAYSSAHGFGAVGVATGSVVGAYTLGGVAGVVVPDIDQANGVYGESYGTGVTGVTRSADGVGVSAISSPGGMGLYVQGSFMWNGVEYANFSDIASGATIHSGTGIPASGLGANGDIYVKY
ncbi:MAG: hypothetical protein HN842_09495 [Gammaproteobacteria bacterium]|nr:hypothetical protein [Gammaproteobacteria bacterium]